MTFTLRIVSLDDTILYTQTYTNESGAKGGTTRKLNSMTRDGIPARALLTDEDGTYIIDATNEQYDWERNEARKQTEEIQREAHLDAVTEQETRTGNKRLWKVIRSGGPNRSFGTEAAAQEYAETLTDNRVEIRYGDTRAPKQCRCGCDEMTKGGTFLPGHDRRFFVMVEKAFEGDEKALAQVSKSGIPTLQGEVEGEYNPEHRCDAACEFAVSDKCVCSCAGENHRAGWAILEDMIG